MPIYEYKGFDTAKGGTKSGIIDADTPREARARLREQAVMVTDLDLSAVSVHAAEDDGKQTPRRSLKEILSFKRRLRGASALPVYTRQLATLLRSGPLTSGAS